jgi:hypothetical protein
MKKTISIDQDTKQSSASSLPIQVFKHSYTGPRFKVSSECVSVGHPGNRTDNVQITSLVI